MIGMWFILFLVLDWWNSYPKIKIIQLNQSETLQSKIDSVIQKSIDEFTLSGIGLGIVKDGKILYQNALGYQNLYPLDSFSIDSKFPTASISKLFTALAVAKYWSSQDFSVEDSIGKILIHQNQTSDLGKLRISDFLSHNSGLKKPNLFKQIISSNSSIPLSEYGDHLWESDFEIPEQVTFEYFDGNFDFLGYELQLATQMPFEEFLKENILIPAGMKNSFFTTSWPIDSINMMGYQETFVWKRIEQRPLTFERLPSPSSGLISSIRDMNLFLIHLLRGKMGIFENELTWLIPETSETPLGFQQIQLNNETWLGHYGGQAGYSSLLIYSPSSNLGLILFSNTRDTKGFRKYITEQILQVLSSQKN